MGRKIGTKGIHMGIKLDLSDIVGNPYGRMVVLNYDHTDYLEDGRIKDHIYRCQCTCLNKTIFFATRHHIVQGHVKSCGCLPVDRMKELGKAAITHGMSKTRFYKIWLGIIKRCSNPNHIEYHNYGGRGITFDFRWWGFMGFYRDMYESYVEHCQIYGEKNTTIERNDPNGMYCKANCRWATYKEQSFNKRTTLYINYEGDKYNYGQILDTFPHDPSITIDIFGARIRRGWDIEKALSEPAQIGHNTISSHKLIYNGQEYTITELLKLCDPEVTRDIFYYRLFKSPIKDQYMQNGIIINPLIFTKDGIKWQ